MSSGLAVPALALALAIAILSSLFYCRGLNVSPVYLTKDEASFGVQSHALATTGRDVNGTSFPLFFQEPGFSIGRDPIYIYATALVLQALPVDARSLRLPAALAGVISIGLTVLVAKELFASNSLAALAGVFLACTPVFFIRSRAALSVIFPVPFQLLWLYLLLRYLRSDRLWHLLGSTLALGVGVYSYLSMLFFMPLHFAATIAALVIRRRWAHLAWASAILAMALIPLGAWQFAHPGRYSEIIGSYHVYDPSLSVAQGAKDLLSWFSLGTRADVYWQALNPSRLFFSGESSLVDSTRTAGLFPVAFVLLLPIGLYEFARRPSSIPRLAILMAFVAGPIPGVIAMSDTVGRYLIVAPFAALIAVAGVSRLWEFRSVVTRVLATLAIVATVVLFRGFYVDYMGDWRVRSSSYLGGNLKGAMESVLRIPPVGEPPLIYLSEHIPYVDIYWEFYRRAERRPDLVGRSRGLSMSNTDWQRPDENAMAIVPGGDREVVDALLAARWTLTTEINEFYGGAPSFLVLTRPSH